LPVSFAALWGVVFLVSEKKQKWSILNAVVVYCRLTVFLFHRLVTFNKYLNQRLIFVVNQCFICFVKLSSFGDFQQIFEPTLDFLLSTNASFVL